MGTPRAARYVEERELGDRDRARWPGRVRRDAVERVRDAVAGCQARGMARLTLEGAATMALLLAARHLEDRWNGGQRFPERVEDLQPGRRPRLRRVLDDEEAPRPAPKPARRRGPGARRVRELEARLRLAEHRAGLAEARLGALLGNPFEVTGDLRGGP